MKQVARLLLLAAKFLLLRKKLERLLLDSPEGQELATSEDLRLLHENVKQHLRNKPTRPMT